MIDFIYNIIYGFDYPGLSLALDPITIAMLVGQGVQQVGKMVEGKKAKERAEDQARKGKDLYDQMIGEFESGKYDLSVSQDVRDAAEQQRIMAEQVADQAAARGEAQIQSALAASRYGDARMQALIPKQAQQIEQQVQSAQLKGLQQKAAADQQLAKVGQDVLTKNQRMMQELGSMKLKRGAADMDAGTLAAAQAQDAYTQALTGLGSAAAQGIALGVGGGGQTKTTTDTTNTGYNYKSGDVGTMNVLGDTAKILGGADGMAAQQLAMLRNMGMTDAQLRTIGLID